MVPQSPASPTDRQGHRLGEAVALRGRCPAPSSPLPGWAHGASHCHEFPCRGAINKTIFCTQTEVGTDKQTHGALPLRTNERESIDGQLTGSRPGVKPLPGTACLAGAAGRRGAARGWGLGFTKPCLAIRMKPLICCLVYSANERARLSRLSGNRTRIASCWSSYSSIGERPRSIFAGFSLFWRLSIVRCHIYGLVKNLAHVFPDVGSSRKT